MNAVLFGTLDCLKCAVCLGTFDQPATFNCGHTFCVACVRNIVRCPLCRAVLPNDVRVNRVLDEMIKKTVMVECANKCGVSHLSGDRDAHLGVCELAQVTCPGCVANFCRKDLEGHVLICRGCTVCHRVLKEGHDMGYHKRYCCIQRNVHCHVQGCDAFGPFEVEEHDTTNHEALLEEQVKHQKEFISEGLLNRLPPITKEVVVDRPDYLAPPSTRTNIHKGIDVSIANRSENVIELRFVDRHGVTDGWIVVHCFKTSDCFVTRRSRHVMMCKIDIGHELGAKINIQFRN